MSLFDGPKPIGATHKWYHQNGSFKGWLKVAQCVYFHDERHGWVAIAKDKGSVSGQVKSL